MTNLLYCGYVFILCFVLLNSEVYNDRPKIKVSDGDLIFEPAFDKNIYLKANGPRSTIFIGDLDYKNLSNATRISQDNLSFNDNTQIHSTKTDDILKRLERLESLAATWTSFNINITRLNRRINTLNSRVASLLSSRRRNECQSHPCENGGTCLNLVNGYHCLCPSNWKGTNCDEDVNECRNFAGTDLGCQNGATCINTPGSYQCICKPGWYGIDCTRTAKNCSQGDFEMCGHGICIPIESGQGIKCLCNQGWTTNGNDVACLTDVNECQSGQGVRCSVNPRVECINLPGSFRCGPCPIGYEGDGFACYDIDECLTIPNGGCSTSPMVSCHNTIGSRICGSCPTGYQGDGVTCNWRGSCSINSGGCHPSALCIDSSALGGVVQCICPFGMDGDGIGLHGCYIAAVDNTTQRCENNPCGAHGHCRQLRNGYTCFCFQGFSGAHCDKQINSCSNNPCHNGGTCRLDERTTRGYRCECTALYSGDLCQVHSQPCGGVLDNEEGSIIYPISNTTYGHNSRCAWVIHTSPDKVINVTFSKFNLEYHSDCRYDFVQIHDGRSSASQLIGRFCGNTFPKGGNIISSHNNLYFWFRSDQTVAKEGFALHWTSITPTCGGEINATTHGHIRSPGSPGSYPPNRDCYWHLSTTLGKRIQLHFFELDIEEHANCSFDFLAIYDGSRKEDPLISQYCNSSQPAPVQSAGSDMLIHFHSDGYGDGKGFQITYAPIEGVPGCGGFFTADKGEIISPSFNGAYLNNLLCEYKIKTNAETKIRIEFKSFSLERSFRCRYDYLKIYDGPSSEAPLVGKFCGVNHPKTYTSTSNNLFIIFKSDHSATSDGFKITYESICFKTIEGDSGILKTPGYPLSYKKNMVCDYVISSTPGKAIVLTFQDFDIEDNRYYNCQYDHVEIRDGPSINSTLIGKYCGGSEFTPPTQTSSHNYMYIRFTSDVSVTGRGFYANYTTINTECGGIHRENTGIINHPADSSTQYSNNQMCTWLLIAPEGMHIKLTWNRFELENMPSCNSDYVLITEIDDNNNNNTIGKYCGSTLPPALTTSSNRLMITFVSDISVRLDGFSLSYTFLDEKSHCGGLYVRTQGFIYSPGWPHTYDLNRDCTWIIKVPDGQQIMLNITDFDLERPLRNNCELGDYLTIRDGSSENSALIGTFCGYFKSKRIVTTANSAYIRFHSDFYLQGNGFKIEWDGTLRGCGGVLNSAYGSISSPNYPQEYNENAECFYRIVTSSGSKIKITFVELDLERTKDCNDDYVEVFDGRDSNAFSFGKQCSKSPKSEIIETSSNFAFIKFRSDIFISEKGFLLNYVTVCNNNISGSYGVIESPGYPNSYPLNINCLWTINVPKGNKINVTFIKFDIFKSFGPYRPFSPIRPWYLSHRNCETAYLEYKEIGDKLFSKKLCGTSLPEPISTKSNSLQIHFVSGNFYPHNGFRLEWVRYGCGSHIQKRFGTLSMDHVLNLADDLDCEWIIETPIGTAVSITFSEIYMTDSKNCSIDAIAVFNGQNTASPLLTKICHRDKSSVTVQSSSNFLLVRLIKRSNLRNIYFNSRFNAITNGCGSQINAPFGLIHSKNYPKNYENNLDCVWLISVPKGHRIELNFISFDLYSTDDNDCDDFITIYDNVENFQSNYTSLLCPKTNITQFLSESSSIKVQFQTDAIGNARGFKANFSMTCGAVINVKTDGIISNSQFINHNNMNCTWVLQAPNPSQKVRLTIQHMSLPKVTDVITNRNCPASYVRVLDGNDDKSPLIDEFCGSKVPPTIISHGSALTVILGSYTSTIKGQFVAHYSVLTNACGGNLSSEEGSIASPNYPLSYPNNANCEWILSTSPGNRVYITFEKFDVDYSENCNDDYLEIRENNEGKLLAVYCGQDIPVNTTTGTKLYIKFYSNDKGTGQGFLLHYGFLHGNEITGSNSGEIASPLYPYPYEGEGEYSWRIITSASTVISVNIDHLQIHTHSDICSSKLIMFDGFDDEAPILQELCGLLNEENKHFQTTSNAIFLKLILDEDNFGSLFHIQWAQSDKLVVDPSEKVNCGSNGTKLILPNSDFEFHSPNYPNEYNSDSNCIWMLEVNPGRHLKLTIKDVSLEETPNCFADYISIFSSDQGEWMPVLEKACRAEDLNKKVFTSKTAMKIQFKSDSSIMRKGFLANVRSLCGGLLQAKSGVIGVEYFDLHDAYYETKIRCNWTIKVRPGRTIKMKFIHFNITNDNECSTFVTLRNGESVESPFIANGKYCGYSHENRDEIISSSNVVTVSYVGANPLLRLSDKFQYFKLLYEEKNIECGLTSSLDNDHSWEIISSPNYPSVPIPYTECIWTFSGPPGEILRIDFLERFDLESSEQCNLESVEIRDGSSQLAPLKDIICKERPGTIKTNSNSVFLKYSTQIAEPRNGFKANISIDVCGGTIIAKSGEVLSPGYPHLSFLPPSTICQWHIISLPKHVIQLNFKDLQLPESEKPCETKITIEESIFANNTSELGKLKEFCDNTMEDYTVPIETLTNKVIIKLHYGKPSQWTQVSESRGFRFTFNSSRPSCGGQITISEGYLLTPGYPHETSLRYCQWTIIAPDVTRRVRLELLDYDNIHDIGVYNDVSFLTAIEGQSNNKSSSSNPEIFESSGNKLSLYIFRNKNKTTFRFKAKFTSDNPALCGGNLQGFHGGLQSPNLEQAYVCEWKYSGAPTSVDTNMYRTLTVNVTVNSTARNICRYRDSKVIINSNVVKKGPLFSRNVCGSNTGVLFNLPELNMNIKATQYKRHPLVFDLDWKLNPCGGVIHAGPDSVNILNVPETLNITIDCAWLIVALVGVRTEFKLDGHFNLDCADEYLQINQGIAQNSLKIGEYCRTKNQEQALLTSFKYTYIQYHSKPQINANVKLMVKTVSVQCGGHLTEVDRIFTSPNYPRNYPDNQECAWEIYAGFGYRISLMFEGRFAIEDKPNCTKDALIIFDWRENKYQEIARLCGRQTPTTFNSTSNKMKVIFRTDNSTNLDGFKAKWVPICGGTLIPKTEEQFLYSPGYTHQYYPSLNCEYIIQSTSNKIQVKFLDFELEGSYPECQYDNLSISAQSDYNYFYGLYCGKETPPQVNGNDKVEITFKTDLYGQKRGFKMSYSLYSCGGTVKQPTIITLSNSEKYIENTNCTWSIEAPLNKAVILKFLYIDIESSYECINDYVAVYDGSNIDLNNRLSLMCGHINTTTVIKSTNNTVTLQFISDSNMNYKGFKVEVLFSYSESVGCGGKIDLTATSSKTLKSPLIGKSIVYENYLDCHWAIKAPTDHFIKIVFTSFHIAPCVNVNQTALGNSKCDCDYVELRDGLNPNSLIIGTYCGHSYPPQLSSSSNTMTVRLSTDGEAVSSGFEAVITAHASQCGNTFFTTSSSLQTLKSPGYDTGVIPRGLHCTYIFDSSQEPYSTVNIRIHELDLDPGTGNTCNNDRITISSHSQPRNISAGKDFIINESLDEFFSRTSYYFDSTLNQPKRFELCGRKKSVDYYVTGNIKINLQTSAVTTSDYKGIYMSISYLGVCGRNYTELQGRILSQTPTVSGTSEQNCLTLITVPENYTISLYFLSVSPVYWNDKVFLKVFDGNTTDTPLLTQISSEYREYVQVFSSSRYLLLQNHFKETESVVYDINYVATDKGRGCGGLLQNAAGRVTSPLYPDIYRKKSTCEWVLETPIGTRIRIHFTVFDLGRICDQNYLSLIDRNGNTISTYCSETPADYTSEDNYVKIAFTTSRNNGGTGWVVDFVAVT